MKKLRFVLAIVILTISIALLIWGFRPLGREIRTQPIAPSDLQLPTPQSFHFQPELVS